LYQFIELWQIGAHAATIDHGGWALALLPFGSAIILGEMMNLRSLFLIGLLFAPLPVAAACNVDDIPSHGVTGFQEAVISVSDLKTAVATWREVGDFEVVCEGRVGADMAQFWGLPKQTKIEHVVLRKRGSARGLVRLVKFHGLDQVQIRSSAMTWDTGGIFDLYMYVDNVHAVFAKLRARGWQSYNDPVTYTLGPFTVTEVIVRGPDGEALCLMQRDAPPYDKAQFGVIPGSDKGFGWPFNAALVSTDFAAGEKLFAEILGWKTHLGGDSKSQPPGDNPLGLPKNIAQEYSRQFAAYAPHPTDRNGSIQIIVNKNISGRDLSGRAHPPNLGNLALRVPVNDLAAFDKEFTAKGGVIATPRRTLELEPYGKVDILAVKAPNGALIEFFAQ
jgi:catechol 2,3-dioxygenase-like lactoylglutathione lyase family enzyme